ncbi:DUF3761 domain-containing protein [Streptomyces sp. NPDC008222]|uniref:DUF3761 domain-containing protein n=1 Tax=Streptomyces sp. NPDC008222 TaxID=3364820 RepID=UPI0036F0FFAF
MKYLYDVDEHRRSQADVETVVQKLRSRCTDNVLVLEFTATNTATDLVDAQHDHQGVYPVLTQLAAGLPQGAGKAQCASRLPTVEKQIKAQRTLKPSPTPTRTTAKPATHKPAPVKTTHRPTVQHTTAAPVDDHGGATALCNDGTLSSSAHHQGTCSHHHGVAVWYK